MPVRGEAIARLSNGQALTLVVNFATVAHAAARLELPPKQVFEVLGKANDPRQALVVLTLLEMALRKHHRGMGEDELGELLLTDTDAQELSDALSSAMNGAFGEPEGKESTNPPKTKRGTGTRSSKGGRKKA